MPFQRRRRGALAGLVAMALMATSAASHAAAASTGDRLPDLAMARPVELRLVRSADGRTRLRFTSSIVNIGEGPFEARASRRSVSQPLMPVKQRIYDSTGGYRVVATRAVASYSGDGHDHWHVQRAAAYALYDALDVGRLVARSSKVGFCLFDTRPFRLSLAQAPTTRRYSQAGCGTRSSLSLQLGISVGWADRYGWALRHQAIDVTNLRAGDYMLMVTADPDGLFVERSVSNNCNWTRIRIPASGSVVSTLGWGAGCHLPAGIAPTPSPTPGAGPTPVPTATPTSTPAPTTTPAPTASPTSTSSSASAMLHPTLVERIRWGGRSGGSP